MSNPWRRAGFAGSRTPSAWILRSMPRSPAPRPRRSNARWPPLARCRLLAAVRSLRPRSLVIHRWARRRRRAATAWGSFRLPSRRPSSTSSSSRSGTGGARTALAARSSRWHATFGCRSRRSFPSGHSAAAFAFATGVGQVIADRRRPSADARRLRRLLAGPYRRALPGRCADVGAIMGTDAGAAHDPQRTTAPSRPADRWRHDRHVARCLWPP